MPLPGTPDQKQYPSDFFTGGSLAYMVGMNGYRFIQPLDSPKNDCLGLVAVLEQMHGFKTTTLFDAERQGVLDLLEQIKQECKPDSRIIFYYAGHGIADGADDEKQRPKGFLLAVDSERGKEETYIEMGQVLEVLVGLPCSHLLIILDCCYAGAIRYAEQTRSIGSSVPKTLYAEKFTYYISNPAKQVITSAACDQKAMDALGSRGELSANHRSPFAESLIQNLAKGDRDWSFGHIQPDGIVTASELGYFLGMEVSDQLSKNNVPFAEQQTPSVFRIGDRTKGEFIFVNSQDAIKKLKPNPVENPWKGLADYSINDNHLFYGRQRVLDGWWEGQTWYEGLLQLVSPEENIRKIMVTGRSGSGKSSLVKAGVLARLEAETPGSVTIITPGSTPFSTHHDLLAALKNKAGKVYLMVDQYEELVTVCSDAAQQKDFEESLAELAALPDAKVIITLRSDLERRFVDSPFVDRELDGNIYRFVVPPFSREEIRETVLQPAIQQLLEFRGNSAKYAEKGGTKSKDPDEDFVNRIIDETFANPDSLPLLSFALNRLFEMKNPSPGNLLLETDYDDFGGISGILNKKLTDAYNVYDPGHQALFRQLIYRMISFDAGYMAKRRVYTTYISDGKLLNELEFTAAATLAAMNAIQQELVKQRLLKTSRENEATGTKDDNVYFEPAHEALLRSSNLISQWQNEGGGAFQGRIILLNAVSAGAKNYYFYDGKGKKGSLWKDDPRLDLVKRMWNTRELYLNKIEETFIVESLRARTRAKRILWTVVTTVFALLSAASVFSYFQKLNADSNAKIAQAQRDTAQQQKKIAQAQTDTATEKKIEAQKQTQIANDQTLKAQNELAETNRNNFLAYMGNKDMLKSYLYLSKALVTSKDEKMNNLMKAQLNLFFPTYLMANSTFSSPDRSEIKSLEVSADGRLLTTISKSSANIWDISTRKLIFSVRNSGFLYGTLYNGTKLYLSTQDELQRWDLKTKKKELTFPLASQALGHATWDLPAKKILISGVRVAILLNLDFKRSSWMLPTDQAALSGDGKRLATYIFHPQEKKGNDYFSPDSIAIWDVDGLKIKFLNKIHIGATAHDFKFSKNGNFLMVEFNNSNVDIYDVKKGRIYHHGFSLGLGIAKFSETENEAFFSDSEQHFFGVDLNNPTDRTGHYQLTDNNYNGFYDIVTFPAKSKYRDSILIDQANGFGYWNLRTGERGSIFDFSDAGASRHKLLYDSIGQKIICLSDDFYLRVYGMNGKVQELESYLQSPSHKPANLRTFQLSPDRKNLFVASGPYVNEYSVFDPDKKLPSKQQITKAFFSSDGKYTFTLDKNKIAKTWKHNSGRDELTGTFSVPRSVSVNAAVFSKNGKAILTEWADGKYSLIIGSKWRPIELGVVKSRPTIEGYPYSDTTGRVQSPCLFSDDGERLLFVNDGGDICSYDIYNEKTSVLCHAPYVGKENENEQRSILLNPYGNSFLLVKSNSGQNQSHCYSFKILNGQAIPQGKIALNSDFHEPLISKFIDNDRITIFFPYDGLFILDLKKQQVYHNSMKSFGTGDTFNKVYLSNDGKKLVVVYKGFAVSMFDMDTHSLIFSTNIIDLKHQNVSLKGGLTASDEGNDFSIALNSDYSELALMNADNIFFVDAKTGKTVVKKNQVKKRPDYVPKAIFEGYNLHFFDGDAVKTIGSDLDLPADLFDLQTSVITGYRLNKATNQPEVLNPGDLVTARNKYETESARHYAICKYKQFNIWKQLKDRL